MDLFFPILRFCIAGGVVSGVVWLAKNIDPKYGGILAAAPITTTLAFLFTWQDTTAGVTRDLVWSAFVFAIPSVFFPPDVISSLEQVECSNLPFRGV
ncbi:MAG TPA: hypothetical protein VN372_00300 [Methanospirillum sp.]|nr:hypothetical protein [Methanospirillum sp.]